MDYQTYLTPSREGSKLFKKMLRDRYGYSWKTKSVLAKIRQFFKSVFDGYPPMKYMSGVLLTDIPAPSDRLMNASEKGRDYFIGKVYDIDEVLTATALTKGGTGIADFVKHSLDELHLCVSKEPTAGFGCSCGIYGKKPHEGGHVTIMTTAENAVTAVEGIVHELGHHRLHAMDIQLLTAPLELIGNDESELYDSPVRFDIQRPMSACVHAEYSYAIVTHFYTDLINYMIDMDLEKIADATLSDIINRQAYNIKRIGNGVRLMRSFFYSGYDPTFRQAMMQYCETQYRRARDQIVQIAPESDWTPVDGDITD